MTTPVPSARFPDLASARRAVEQLELAGIPSSACELIAPEAGFRGTEAQNLPLRGTRARSGLLRGTLAGTVAGGLTIAGLALVAGVQPGPLAYLAGSALGALYGALAGGLTGAAHPHQSLTRAAERLRPSEVLVVVNWGRESYKDQQVQPVPPATVHRILETHGGRLHNAPGP